MEVMPYEYLINSIVNKWGELHCGPSYFYSGTPAYLMKGFFNYIFMPVNLFSVNTYMKKKELVLSEELQDFYHKCNGVKIALSAFSIYGFPLERKKTNPYDLLIENIRIHEETINNECDNSNLLYFGSFSGLVVFAYDMKTQKIVCMKKGTNRVLISFDSLYSLFQFFIPRICEEYDDDCYKIKMNEEYLDIPLLANTLLTLPGIDVIE